MIQTTRPPLRISLPARASAVAVSLMLLAACGSDAAPDTATPTTVAAPAPAESTPVDDNATPSTTRPAATPDSVAPAAAGAVSLASLPEDEQQWLTNYATAIKKARDVWPEFDPEKLATVVSIREKDESVQTAYVFGHDNPSAIGESTPVDTTSLGIAGVFRITKPADPDRLAGSFPYEINAHIGGQVTFAMGSVRGHEMVGIGQPRFASMVVHEAFHQFQIDPSRPSFDMQDFDGYDYSPENIELAFLEDRILTAADTAKSADERKELARQMVAVRAVREARDARVALDHEQERLEGTARYIEHHIGDALNLDDNTSNFARHLIPGEQDAKTHLSRTRFYQSGAAVIALIDQFGPADGKARINAGERPVNVLAAAVKVSADERAGLVEEARKQHDPDNKLPALAATASKQALAEGPLNPQDEPVLVTDEQQDKCLAELGVDPAEDEITAEHLKKCDIELVDLSASEDLDDSSGAEQ